MSSVQPQDISSQLIDLWQEPRLCRHFHLALQSGSQAVLQRMRRRYSAHQYRDAVRRLRDAVPDVAITTDVIVGFPGETEAEFEESYAFCREMAFAGLHVFPYSQRSGTLAARMLGQVPEPVKKQRVQRLRSRFLGRTLPVLWEARHGDAWEGLTDTYIRVRAQSDADLHNRLIDTRLVAMEEAGLFGEVTP
jgi:threonylcarbamoyladenosine tRNA methylthiotransferase MtaB